MAGAWGEDGKIRDSGQAPSYRDRQFFLPSILDRFRKKILASAILVYQIDGMKEFFLADFEANVGILESYVKMRLAALAGSLAILGAIFAIQAQEGFVMLLTKPVLMMVVVFAAIKVIASLNRNVFARCLYLSIIEKEVGETGFYRCWRRFLRSNPKDLSGYAIGIACQTINVCVMAFTLIVGATLSGNALISEITTSVLGGLIIFINGILFIINGRNINYEFKRSAFMPAMEENLEHAYEQISRQPPILEEEY